MTPAGVFARGLAMGAADIVPGVSGGTIAFISGIYPRLLHALRSFDLRAVRLLLAGDVAGAWRHVDGGFLLALALGIATSLVSLARLISWLLVHQREPLWSFFFGLILASALILVRQVGEWKGRQYLALLLGVAIALWVALTPAVGFLPGLPGVFLAGFIAICAMILPGISGSFILVLLGMYSSVLFALKNFDFLFLAVFALGAGCGLMVFSRLLYWLLKRFRSVAIALLTGFLFGSLTIVWPWKRVLDWILDSHGQLKPVQQLPVLPTEYLVRTGEEPLVVLCLACASLGFLTVWLIDHYWGHLQVELD